MTIKTVLQTQQLSIGYPKHPVADGINESLFAGELVCLIGPNGAGKTTLMRTMAGMLSPLAGGVSLLGDDIRSIPSRTLAQRLSVVLTDRIDVGLLTGYALVALGRHPYTDWTGNLSPEDIEIIKRAVRDVGAVDIAGRNVNELSDGERQKLMIARALAQDPALMILDEPTAFLDLPRRVEIMQLLRNLACETNRAILLSTHDLDLALRNADRVWLMPKNGDLIAGAPEDLVLNDSFEAAFKSEGVQFDKRTGSFRPAITANRQIALRGQGIRLIWTQHAIERAGFIVDDSASIEITVTETAWSLKRGANNNTPEKFETLYALTRTLNTM